MAEAAACPTPPTNQHPLKSKWTINYTVSITPQMIQDAGGKYEVAQQKALRHIGDISTVEELWSAVNALPSPYQLPVGDYYTYARDNMTAQFENFPNGTRIAITCYFEAAVKHTYETVLALVLGESVTKATNDEAVVDIIRVLHKPFKDNKATTRVELWLRDKKHLAAVKDFIKAPILKVYSTAEIVDFPWTK